MRLIALALALALALSVSLLPPALARADDAMPDELAVLQRFRGVDVVESANDVGYGAKGPDPWLDHASINVEVRDGRAHTIAVKKLAIVSVSAGECPKKPAKGDIKTFAVAKHELYNWTDVDPIAHGTASVRIAAATNQRYGVKASFAGLLTTSACRFDVEISIDRVRKRIRLPISIRSYDPIGK